MLVEHFFDHFFQSTFFSIDFLFNQHFPRPISIQKFPRIPKILLRTTCIHPNGVKNQGKETLSKKLHVLSLFVHFSESNLILRLIRDPPASRIDGHGWVESAGFQNRASPAELSVRGAAGMSAKSLLQKVLSIRGPPDPVVTFANGPAPPP